MKTIKVAYIGGGSKNWAHKYFADFLTQDMLEGEIRLYDTDKSASEFNKELFDRMVRDNQDKIKAKWICKVENDIDNALIGADVVLISILPYSLENMRFDVHYPEKYGIYQSVGDTVGPGGYSRALRTLGSFGYFAEKIKKNCPDAWVINYTNPLSMCVNMLYKTFPEIKAFGCCHEVFGTQWLMAGIVALYKSLSEAGKKSFMCGNLKAVKEECRAKGKRFEKIYSFNEQSAEHAKITVVDKKANIDPVIHRSEIKVNVVGINHFTFVNKAEYMGQDIMPIYRAYIRLFRENNKNRLQWYVPDILKRMFNKENVKFELFEKYGIAGAAGDRHLAEFLPEQYLPLHRKNILAFGFELTPVWGRILHDKYLKHKRLRSIRSKDKLKIVESGEEGVIQLTALMGLKDLTTNVNVINRGQAPDLPLDTAVETNAKFTLDHIEPIPCGTIDNPAILERERLHAQNQKDFVDAFFRKDKADLLRVFLKDPSVARIGEEKGKALFEEMIACNKEVLEDWIRK